MARLSVYTEVSVTCKVSFMCGAQYKATTHPKRCDRVWALGVNDAPDSLQHAVLISAVQKRCELVQQKYLWAKPVDVTEMEGERGAVRGGAE